MAGLLAGAKARGLAPPGVQHPCRADLSTFLGARGPLSRHPTSSSIGLQAAKVQWRTAGHCRFPGRNVRYIRIARTPYRRGCSDSHSVPRAVTRRGCTESVSDVDRRHGPNRRKRQPNPAPTGQPGEPNRWRTERNIVATILVWTSICTAPRIRRMWKNSPETADRASVRTKPRQVRRTLRFDSLEQEVFLNLWRTYDRLRALEDALFTQFDLTPQQYNILRLLQACRPAGLPTLQLAAQLVSRAPDITRMLDKLEDRGWIARHRMEDNRRVVVVKITSSGIRWIRRIAKPLKESHRQQLGHLSAAELKSLRQLLLAARRPHEKQNSHWNRVQESS